MELPQEEGSKQSAVHVQRPWGEKLACWRKLEQGGRRGEWWEARSERRAGWEADQAGPDASVSLDCILGSEGSCGRSLRGGGTEWDQLTVQRAGLLSAHEHVKLASRQLKTPKMTALPVCRTLSHWGVRAWLYHSLPL